jgi:hypothetical protein
VCHAGRVFPYKTKSRRLRLVSHTLTLLLNRNKQECNWRVQQQGLRQISAGATLSSLLLLLLLLWLHDDDDIGTTKEF